MKKFDKAHFKFMLETNNAWLYRGLIAIYNRQTQDEKTSQLTQHDNSIGFNGADAPYLSYVARYYLDRGYLTGTHLEKTRKKMIKYAGQLVKIAEGQM